MGLTERDLGAIERRVYRVMGTVLTHEPYTPAVIDFIQQTPQDVLALVDEVRSLRAMTQ